MFNNMYLVIQSALFIPSWRSLNPLKRSLNHHKKVTLNHQVKTNLYNTLPLPFGLRSYIYLFNMFARYLTKVVYFDMEDYE